LVKNIFCDDLRNFEPKIVTPLSFKKKCTNACKSNFFLIVSFSTQCHDTYVLRNLSSNTFPSGCEIAAKSPPMTILGNSTVSVYSRFYQDWELQSLKIQSLYFAFESKSRDNRYISLLNKRRYNAHIVQFIRNDSLFHNGNGITS
jgi:hypothetical protein